MIARCVWAILVSMAVASPSAAVLIQTPVFSSRVDVVRVDALVTDGERVVTGLGRSNFEVFDNGVRQNVDQVSFERLPVNVMIALDVSGSVTGELDHLRIAARSVVAALQPDDSVGILTFSNEVAVRVGLQRQDRLGDLRNVLDGPTVGGETALFDASYSALVLSDVGVGRPLAIVFSDGEDTASFLGAEEVLATARRSDTVVYAAAVGGVDRSSFIAQLCEQTGGRVLGLESARDLGTTLTRILGEFRQRYVISYSPRGVPGTGWHQIRVRVTGQRVTVRARPGYFASR